MALTKRQEVTNRQCLIGNLLEAVDSAFLDRVDIKQFVPRPAPRAAYEIFRSCLNELVRCEILIEPGAGGSSHDPFVAVQLEDMQLEDPGVLTSPDKPFPGISETSMGVGNELGNRLWEIAQQCGQLSGRTLRRLPFQALAIYTCSKDCTVTEGLRALSVAVDRETARESTEGAA
jgi:hypothetical protein